MQHVCLLVCVKYKNRTDAQLTWQGLSISQSSLHSDPHYLTAKCSIVDVCLYK